MCGIFGFTGKTELLNISLIDQTIKHLGRLSESRGSDASGLFIYLHDSKRLLLHKSTGSFLKLIKSKAYKDLLGDLSGELDKKQTYITVIGHTRLTTNGFSFFMENNQPIVLDEIVLAHNGIITNEEDFFHSNSDSKYLKFSDTHKFAVFLNEQLRIKNSASLEIMSSTFKKIKGTAAIVAFTPRNGKLFFYSNNGSLYYSNNNNFVVFASQKNIVSEVINKTFFNEFTKNNTGTADIFQIRNIISIHPGVNFDVEEKNNHKYEEYKFSRLPVNIKKYYDLDYPDFKSIRRCIKCCLPASFPGLVFDLNGVCSECHSYTSTNLKPINELNHNLLNIAGHEKKVLVGVSGGRDSCYGLHVLKKELGFTPVAFTYDWGMVTDIARRNTANICGSLGVEHIIISPNIEKKLNNIRLNISAWLARPSLQMVPLFMAGDKYFYYHAHKLRKSLNIPAFLFCAGNRLEVTNFKTRFGLRIDSPENGILTGLDSLSKIKLLAGYASQCILNPRYLNTSIFDTLGAFYSSYILQDDYFYLYHYYPWNESEVEGVLINSYGWEGANSEISGWRVGDGTAAFYNYIYYVVAGFTEHDTFRSNQIREGAISREVALKKIESENQPRWEMLEWYASRVGFNLSDALRKIHAMKKIY